jgi:hypothetical protein
MNLNCKTVVNYVKNLFPGCAPVASSKTPELDANVLSRLSLNNRYNMEARNGKKYWYCYVNERDIPVVKRIMRINGLHGFKHWSLFDYCWVVRVPVNRIEKDGAKKAFVNNVMNKDKARLDIDTYNSRLNEIRQHVK